MAVFNIWNQPYCYDPRAQRHYFDGYTLECTIECANEEEAIKFAKERAQIPLPVVSKAVELYSME